MKNITYREKLARKLKEFGLKDTSIVVYLAGTRNKMPSKYIRLKLSQDKSVNHPFEEWGLKIKEYLNKKSKNDNFQ